MNEEKHIKEIKIDYSETILEALKQMDFVNKKSLIVYKNSKFFNIISIGDIQRALIQNVSMDTKINKVLRKKTRIAKVTDTVQNIKKTMYDFRIEIMPVVNNDNNLEKVYLWEDFFEKKEIKKGKKFNLPVVIMAGGKGSRLKPLTNVLPKPLIPLKEKSMLEEIFDRFNIYGCDNFFISVNYKYELIKFYIERLNLPFNITFFKEDKPLGTAGSLHLLKGKINDTFFVKNCDIIIEEDYSEILDYHKKNKNDITIVAALKHFPIPYGTIKTLKDGELDELIEKPELTFKINTGMYVLEPMTLDFIPKNKFYHITELIDKIKKNNGKIGVFPISEKSWKDIGKWDQYLSNKNS
tara:strand:+ start:458 stop:1516 length:1059 start_codon:yes stop_codon:yes gene_type:complete